MLRVSGLTKIYRNTVDRLAGGIRDASFHLEPGTFFTLLGPSGCGKTTTLRCIAGLEEPDAGTVQVGDRILCDVGRGVSVPLHLREIGMVFQSYAIWPHMTVYENVAFPLKVAKNRRYARAEIESMVRQALQSVGLDGYQSRSATRLSGGQQQRVALARAIVHRPKLLLLDEPLSNLDAALREEMRTELKRLQRQIGITAVYVTHDQSEALAMSDEIAVIDRGRIVQQGSPWDIYFKPRNEFVANFIGQTNLLRGTLAAAAGKGSIQDIRLHSGPVLRCEFAEPVEAAGSIAISVRPENIAIRAAADGAAEAGRNTLSGKVRSASFLGSTVRYEVEVGELVIRVEGNPANFFDAESEVRLSFDPKHTIAVPAYEPADISAAA